MTIILKNLNTEQPAEDNLWQVRIDRGYSVLANPYKLHTGSIEDRQLVVMRYKRWFMQKCEQKGEFLKELYRLHKIYKKFGKLELFCWCSPKLCHGNVIKQFLELSIMENCYEYK